MITPSPIFVSACSSKSLSTRFFWSSLMRASTAFISHSSLASSPILPLIGQKLPELAIAILTLSSWQSSDTLATFMPKSYNSFDALRRSQFRSFTVLPPEMPNICVCTAPEIPTTHKSDPLVLTCGDIADGGGLCIVVSIDPLELILVFVFIVLSSA